MVSASPCVKRCAMKQELFEKNIQLDQVAGARQTGEILLLSLRYFDFPSTG